MKPKNKILAVVEIAIVLCSVFLMTIPVIIAEQTKQEVSASSITTASEDDFVLDVYGNANEDDTIDMRDLTYVKLIFFGKKPETELADAKYDGKINPLDFIQIKLIIVGKEKELTIVDSADRIVTVKKPIEKIVVMQGYATVTIRTLGAMHKIVGVDGYTKERKALFIPELTKLPSVGLYSSTPDIEAILSLEPDLVVTYAYAVTYLKDLPSSIPVVGLYLYHQPGINIEEEVKKLGYILGNEEEADLYICEFYNKYIDPIKAGTEGLSEEEKPKVYVEYYKHYMTYGSDTGIQFFLETPGGRNLFADLSGMPTVDPEEVIERNPDIIIVKTSRAGGYAEDDPSGMKELRDEIMNRPELADVSAVKSGRVYVSTSDLYGLQSPVLIAYWAKWFHPDLFSDLNPLAIHQEFIDRFCLGLDYDAYEHGVFVYHPEDNPHGR